LRRFPQHASNLFVVHGAVIISLVAGGQ
jgi:hypothetical protein